jgi:DNA-directed RNA polymerase specialized sigma24 family protein
MDDDSNTAAHSPQPRFLTTRWTLVLSARGETPEAKESLRELCNHYYAPVFAFIHFYTRQDERARDWTHAFFLKLLEGRSLDTLQQARGKFRSFLLGAVKHFLSDQRGHDRAAKRGGSVHHISIDASGQGDVSGTGHKGDQTSLSVDTFPPDAYFDKQWALAILQRSLGELEAEVHDPATPTRFELLRPWLSGDAAEYTQSEVAERLGVSLEVVKVTIHRWRKRFRTIVKSQIAATVDSPQALDEELSYLIQALTASNF